MPSEFQPEVGELAATLWQVSCVAGENQGCQALWPPAPDSTRLPSAKHTKMHLPYVGFAPGGFWHQRRGGLTKSEVFPQAGGEDN